MCLFVCMYVYMVRTALHILWALHISTISNELINMYGKQIG